MPDPDYAVLVTSLSRDDFVATCPFPLLLGYRASLPSGAAPPFAAPDIEMTAPGTVVPKSSRRQGESTGRLRPEIFAVRKVQDVLPAMITVGRTSNNDLVISSSGVSKFHAYFRVLEDRIELADAGSRNGTWIGERRLAPKGTASIVLWNERVRFAHLEFRLMDANTCWDLLHRGRRG